MAIGATNDQTSRAGSYTSTELRQFQESQPPTAYTRPFRTVTAAWYRPGGREGERGSEVVREVLPVTGGGGGGTSLGRGRYIVTVLCTLSLFVHLGFRAGGSQGYFAAVLISGDKGVCSIDFFH